MLVGNAALDLAEARDALKAFANPHGWRVDVVGNPPSAVFSQESRKQV